jgi:Mrp family chromosome partitioning ATPase
MSLSNLQAAAVLVMEIEPQLAALQRKNEEEQKDYLFYSSKLEKAQEGVSNGDGNMTDVRVVQTPTPPDLDTRKLKKLTGAALAGCVALGLGIAFLIDLVLDRTIKRSSEVRRLLRLPVIFTVPHTAWKNSWCPAWLSRKRHTKIQRYDSEANVDASVAGMGLSPWNPVHHLRIYTDGLRERLLTYFEVNNLEHQPKSVAVTSCGAGVGVTSLASGLAASLSMTGSGNVLLVDMNVGEGAVQSFHKGNPGCGLSQEPGDEEDPAVISANLYLASVPAGGNPSDNRSKALPDVFSDLMPKLKVSGYDYIVFDMPPVSQSSLTPRLSGHMDMVLLVIESEKTSRHVAAQSRALMLEARANVFTILNKCRQHVPESLAGEL